MKMEISCEICRDLMPLVRDGVAGADSREAVMAHLEGCEACRMLFEEEIPVQNREHALDKAVKRVQTVSAMIYWGLVLVGMFICEMVMQFSSIALLLAAFSVQCLLRVTFSPEKGKYIKKTVALLAAAALLWGIFWSWNELFGNPVTKARAEAHIQGYLEGTFGDSDYYIEKVRYDWSASYQGYIRSQADPELEFRIVYRDGKIIYDTYDEDVLNIWE